MSLKNEFSNFYFQEGDWVVEFDPDCLAEGGDVVTLKITETYGDE